MWCYVDSDYEEEDVYHGSRLRQEEAPPPSQADRCSSSNNPESEILNMVIFGSSFYQWYLWHFQKMVLSVRQRAKECNKFSYQLLTSLVLTFPLFEMDPGCNWGQAGGKELHSWIPAHRGYCKRIDGNCATPNIHPCKLKPAALSIWYSVGNTAISWYQSFYNSKVSVSHINCLRITPFLYFLISGPCT